MFVQAAGGLGMALEANVAAPNLCTEWWRACPAWSRRCAHHPVVRKHAASGGAQQAGAPPLTYMERNRMVWVESLPGTFSSSNLLPSESVAVTACELVRRGVGVQGM